MVNLHPNIFLTLFLESAPKTTLGQIYLRNGNGNGYLIFDFLAQNGNGTGTVRKIFGTERQRCGDGSGTGTLKVVLGIGPLQIFPIYSNLA